MTCVMELNCPILESALTAASDTADLLKTPLHALHLELGARMVPFAGYSMPVQYPAGLMAEHQHTRASAGLLTSALKSSKPSCAIDPIEQDSKSLSDSLSAIYEFALARKSSKSVLYGELFFVEIVRQYG